MVVVVKRVVTLVGGEEETQGGYIAQKAMAGV